MRLFIDFYIYFLLLYVGVYGLFKLMPPKLEQTGADRNRLEQTGADWSRLGQLREGSGRAWDYVLAAERWEEPSVRLEGAGGTSDVVTSPVTRRWCQLGLRPD